MKKNSVFLIFTLLIITACSNNIKDGIKQSGRIKAVTVTLSSPAAEQVLSIFKKEGERVNKGDTLIIINPEQLKIKLRQAGGILKAAKARVEMLRKGARKEDLALAKLIISEAESSYELAKKTKARMEKLLSSKSITKSKYDEVNTKFKIAQSKLGEAKLNLEKLKKFARPEEIRQAEGNYESAKANVVLLKKMISDCYVTSPVNGIISERYVEVGERVAPMSALCKIADLSNLKLDIYIKETDLAKVKPGESAEITVDSAPNEKFEGKIAFISPEAEFTPKTIQTQDERTKLVYRVEIRVKNKNLMLKDGMPADAEILIGN